MLILATLADVLILAGACAILGIAYCCLCDLVDETIERLWRGNDVRR